MFEDIQENLGEFLEGDIEIAGRKFPKILIIGGGVLVGGLVFISIRKKSSGSSYSSSNNEEGIQFKEGTLGTLAPFQGALTPSSDVQTSNPSDNFASPLTGAISDFMSNADQKTAESIDTNFGSIGQYESYSPPQIESLPVDTGYGYSPSYSQETTPSYTAPKGNLKIDTSKLPNVGNNAPKSKPSGAIFDSVSNFANSAKKPPISSSPTGGIFNAASNFGKGVNNSPSGNVFNNVSNFAKNPSGGANKPPSGGSNKPPSGGASSKPPSGGSNKYPSGGTSSKPPVKLPPKKK